MIDRTYRFRLQGVQSRTIYIERYYPAYEMALTDLTDICRDYREYVKDFNDAQYTAIIEERIELYESATYNTARLETFTKDKP